MKTSKEFFERLQTDEAFAKEINETVKEKLDEGLTDYKEMWIPLAEKYGYELTAEELDEMYKKISAEMSDEELGKVAGGTTPVCISATLASVASLVLATIGISIGTQEL